MTLISGIEHAEVLGERDGARAQVAELRERVGQLEGALRTARETLLGLAVTFEGGRPHRRTTKAYLAAELRRDADQIGHLLGEA